MDATDLGWFPHFFSSKQEGRCTHSRTDPTSISHRSIDATTTPRLAEVETAAVAQSEHIQKLQEEAKRLRRFKDAAKKQEKVIDKLEELLRATIKDREGLRKEVQEARGKGGGTRGTSSQLFAARRGPPGLSLPCHGDRWVAVPHFSRSVTRGGRAVSKRVDQPPCASLAHSLPSLKETFFFCALLSQCTPRRRGRASPCPR